MHLKAKNGFKGLKDKEGIKEQKWASKTLYGL
jgi:hypothetical protein